MGPAAGGALLEVAELPAELVDLALEARHFGGAREAEQAEQALELLLEARLRVLAERLGPLHGRAVAELVAELARAALDQPALLLGALLEALVLALHVLEGAFETLAAFLEDALIPCHGVLLGLKTARNITRCVSASSRSAE